MDKVLVIVGPTAVGKTALSIQLAKKFNGEIISGDSMQIYRSLDIGTAKVTEEEMAGIPHYLINEREMSENYSVADFQKTARKYIAEITQRNKLPIIVGGTGLYIQALLYDFQLGAKDEPTPEQQSQRAAYEQLAEKIGNEALWQQLQAIDPLAAEKIHYNNRRKVIRAIEVMKETGHSIFAPKEQPQALYDYLMIGLDTNRELLYQRINQRVDLMMDAGILEEAKQLFTHPEYQSAQGIGYKEFFPYFAGDSSLDEAIAEVKQNSRRYAKRQLTWFRNRSNAQWFNLLEDDLAEMTIEKQIECWLNNVPRGGS